MNKISDQNVQKKGYHYPGNVSKRVCGDGQSREIQTALGFFPPFAGTGKVGVGCRRKGLFRNPFEYPTHKGVEFFHRIGRHSSIATLGKRLH